MTYIPFFSQNNNRGGYNVGDKTNKAATSAKDQYNMVQFIMNLLSLCNNDIMLFTTHNIFLPNLLLF